MIFMVYVTINGIEDFFQFDGNSESDAMDNCVAWFAKEYPTWTVTAKRARRLK